MKLLAQRISSLDEDWLLLTLKGFLKVATVQPLHQALGGAQ